MKEDKISAKEKVKRAIQKSGYSFEVLELPGSTRTAKEAAATIGCTISEIAKSLIFKGIQSGKPVLVIASGSNRVDTAKVRSLINEEISKADAEYIRSETGFAIGGIPPVGHNYQLLTIIDEDLMNYETIWAAAGTPFSVFSLQPNHLPELTGGKVATVKL